MPEPHPRSCELIDGKVVRMSPPGFIHAIVSQTVSQLLADFVAERDLGRVISSEVGFIVSRDPDTVLAPDGAFIRQDRFDAIGIPTGYYPEAPALVYEVVSPNDKPRKVIEKMLQWIEGGVELAWMIDPPKRVVAVYRKGDQAAMLGAGDVVTGDPVLPGFKCRVADFFAGL